MVAYPVETDHEEAKDVTEDLGPQLEDQTRYFFLRRHIGYPNVKHQQGHDDGENGIGKEDEAIQLPGAAVF
jgi:hypothetical protein